MAPTDPKPAAKVSWVLAPVGVIAAGVLAALLESCDRIGRDGQVGHILGSFFALLALGGAGLLVVHGRRPAAAAGAPAGLAGRIATRLSPLVQKRVLLPLLLLASVGVLAYWFRDLALSHDHAEHCFKAYHFWTEMLGRGRLSGWSHFLAFGYPSGELMPFGPELWVALFRAATLGLLSWPHTYALAFASAVVFAVVAVYSFAKRRFGVAAAIIAALLWVLDPGDWYQGGWFWFVWLGVWPVTLSMSFTLLALNKLSDVLSADRERQRSRDVLWGAFWIFASLLSHQLPLVVYPIALPALYLSEKLTRPRLPDGALLRLGATAGLGFGLAAFFLVPMVSRAAFTLDLGVRGFSVDDLAARFVDMRVIEHTWSLIVVLALAGGVLAVRSRTAQGRFFVVCGAVFAILSSEILVEVFHVERLTLSILKTQSPRMLLVAKVFWFPLAGYAAVSLFRLTPLGVSGVVGAAGARPPLSLAQRCCWLVLAASLGAPLLRPAAVHVYDTQIKKDIEDRSTSDLWRDLQPFYAWSRAERRATGDLYRIGYVMQAHDHLFSISPVFNQTLFYKQGFTTARLFNTFPMTLEPQLSEALSLKYVVADRDIPAPELVLDRRFGQLRVYRNTGYRPQHPFTLLGGGNVELVEFEPERVHLRLQGITPGSRLKLHVARYPRWEATLNGHVVPISPATVYGMEYPFLMEVPAADGDLVFRYVRRAPDWAGLTLTLLSLLFFGLAATGRMDLVFGPRAREQITAAARRLAPVARWVAVGGIAVVLGVAGWRMARPPRLSPRSPFAMAISQPGSELTFAQSPCQWSRREFKWSCGPHEVRPDIATGAFGAHFCFTSPENGPLVLSMSTKLGRFLQGTYDPRNGPAGRIRVFINDKMAGETPTRGDDQGLQFVQVDTRPQSGQTSRLRIEIDGPALRCFDFNIEP